MAGSAKSAVPPDLIATSSEPKEAATLETPETRLQKIHGVLFELAPDAMIVSDCDGHILELNAEAEKAFGYSREELIGQNIEKLIPQRLRGVHKRHRDIYQAEPIYRPMGRGQSIVALRNDGSEFPVEISLSPVSTDRGLLFYAIIRDISERVAAVQLAERLKFEQTVAGLSARFINLPTDRVDSEITAGLEVLVEALDTVRASLGQFDPPTRSWAEFLRGRSTKAIAGTTTWFPA
jgi:PAS domain S-box-containing protein